MTSDTVFEYNEADPTNGILYSMFSKGKEYYENNVFVRTSSCPDSKTGYEAIDFNNDAYWIAANNQAPGEYITIISVIPIKIRGYVIQTSKLQSNCCHPQHWSMATSFDGVNYIHNETYDDTDNHMNNYFSHKYIEYPTNIARYFRIYVTGKSYCGHYNFDLNQVELFGTLLNKYYRNISCRIKSTRFREIFVSIFILCTY